MTLAEDTARYDVDDFAARAGRVSHAPDEADGDFRFNTGLEDLIRAHAVKDAAVLVGVIERAGEARMVLTKRNERMRTHSGQVALPGGRIDPDDASPVAAALRECEEETAVPRDALRPVGQLPVYLSGSGYRIHPVLAVIEGDPPMRPNPGEVETIFEVPLAYLMDRANHRRGSVEWRGKRRYFIEMPWGDQRIWGVTAGIIRTVSERLYG